MTKRIMSIILIICILFISTLSFAVTEKELNDKKNDIENSINEKEDKIDDIQGEKESALNELEKLSEEIETKEEEIAELNRQITTLNKEISETKTKLEEAQKKYDEQYDMLCKRMVAQYKMGNVSYLDVLLNSKSLTDFISKYYIIGKIAEFDTKLLEQIEGQKRTIENSKKELEKKKSELSEKQSKLKVEQITLSNKKANKNKYVSQLSEQEKQLSKELDQLRELRKQTENEIKELARQQAKVNTAGHVYTGGKLSWPCPNYSRISSYFGYRGSGATGGVGSANHKGIDLAAPKGVSILSSEAGVVIKVSNTCTHNYPKTASTKCSCGGGFGNYIMVSHGGGLVTLYAHCTSISVSVGQVVSANQQIGTVGCTGYSTGNHLHFSVLLDGAYVNPAPYLGM